MKTKLSSRFELMNSDSKFSGCFAESSIIRYLTGSQCRHYFRSDAEPEKRENRVTTLAILFGSRPHQENER